MADGLSAAAVHHYAVPLLDLVGDRDRLLDWARAKGEDGIEQYWGAKNARSLDGLPGLGA